MLVPGIPGGKWCALAVFILASLTDFLDGYLARKRNIVTVFGKFMDPLADKLLVCSALICFVGIEDLHVPAWVVVIIISRDFIISGFRMVAIEAGKVIAASYLAKFKTATQMVMCCFFIGHLSAEIPAFYIVEQVLLYGALILTVVSLIEYLYKNRDIISDGFSSGRG
jgi:CDP-diacylglycerol--glycerol-3-phosphate 3-phosphatidyltransferase